jgi:transposase
MRANDGRKLDQASQEVIRLRAVRQVVQERAHPADVAAALGVHRGTVYGWLARYYEGGEAALRARPVPGRPRKLTGAQMRRLAGLVRQDPRDLGFADALWTRAMVAELIWSEFGTRVSVTVAGRILHRLGFTPQRPLHQAAEQDPEAVERWKDEEYPAIREQARRDGGTIYFADEAGIRSDYHAGTTWAPEGQTPVVEATGKRAVVNMISALTPRGALRFAVYEGNTNAAVFTGFCARLLHDAPGPGPVYLIVDGHPAHRARATRDFVASSGGRLKLVFLPGYSPQLNPGEWVWKNIKADRLGRAGLKNAAEMGVRARAALHRLQKLPRLIRGFLADPDLSYITA